MTSVANPVISVNDSWTIILLDIPLSIASAQSFPEGHGRKLLLSCPPRDEPYPSTEPKTAAAVVRVKAQSGWDVGLHETYAELAKVALDDIREKWGDSKAFCLPRVVIPGLEPHAQKRSRVQEEDGEEDQCRSIVAQVDCSFQHHSPFFHHNRRAVAQNFRFKYSSTSQMAALHDKTYLLPPRSAFLLSRVPCSTFRAQANLLIPSSTEAGYTKGRFPFILLDPPWSNKSASRKSSYNTVADFHELKRMLLLADLDVHIAEEGFVAIWVTGRTACRNVVLGPGGLFAAWGLELVEEWIWVKVTGMGEPVTAINGLWRKPYEVCLVGKRTGYATIDPVRAPVTRRVIVGVPDLHSRKPCLKDVVEKLLFPNVTNRPKIWGLEVFARYCVTGWLAWGDQAVLFNNSDWWAN